jgi:hypothetical protein
MDGDSPTGTNSDDTITGVTGPTFHKNSVYKDDGILIILPPGVTAFGAAEKPDLAFIRSPELPEPPERQVVIAFGAPDRKGGKGARGILLYDHNLPLAPLCRPDHLIILTDLPDIPAFPALELTCRGDHEVVAFGTEHRYPMRVQPRLTLV